MKIKTTRRSIVETTAPKNLLSAGYCDLQTLLRNHSPIAYTCGVYGWNFDVYEVYGKTICTGYRGMPGRRANNIGEYEKRRGRSWMNTPATMKIAARKLKTCSLNSVNRRDGGVQYDVPIRWRET